MTAISGIALSQQYGLINTADMKQPLPVLEALSPGRHLRNNINAKYRNRSMMNGRMSGHADRGT
jgi:hypothetical protein